MKKILLTLAGAAFVFGLSGQAKADLMLEPYIGYAKGALEAETTAGSLPAAYDEDETGTTLGARVGYELPLPLFGLSFGGEYQMTTLGDFDSKNLGGYVALEFPILVRAFAGYFLSASSSDATGKEYKGNGYKAGVGLTMLPLVSLNLEYVVHDYSSYSGSDFPISDFQGTGIEVSGMNLHTLMATVSLPLSL